jgi:hypothetical protein
LIRQRRPSGAHLTKKKDNKTPSKNKKESPKMILVEKWQH